MALLNINTDIDSMNTIHNAHDTAAPTSHGVPVMLMATGAGLAVASLYYSQPLLGDLGAQLGIGNDTIGLIPMLTQLGYAAGILLLIPLGDRYDRRTIILMKSVMLVLALLATALAPGMQTLLVTSLALGLAATLAQDIVPSAAALAPAAHRGKVIGSVMTGLLLGILLSRVASGFIAELLGWRAVYGIAAGVMAMASIAFVRRFPRVAPSTTLSYRALLVSMWGLMVNHGDMRRAALAQGLLSVAFGAFWSALAVMLHGAPFHLGSAAAGAFGLAGAAGALAAPVVGKLADRRGPEVAVRMGAALSAIGFAMMLAMPLLPVAGQLVLIGVSALVFDFGIQAALVSHQTIVYGLAPEARSRLNALLFTAVFIGFATGSAAGGWTFAHIGWGAVSIVCAVMSVAALIVRLVGTPRSQALPV
jgi:predicted MFS family arabinose efflux permease